MSSGVRGRSLANVLTNAPKKISKLLKVSCGLPDGGDGPEDTHWSVGGRYLVLQPLNLHARPDLDSDLVGRIKPRDTVLLLALQSIPEEPDPNQPQVLLAYLANTKKLDWVAGWTQIAGSSLYVPVLRLRRLKGSWEVGGRYVVNGNPILRSSIELESEHINEIKAEEEVLVLDLGLVIRSGEPRLRARVRTDAGFLGWLTIELPGGEPLLDPINLYSEDALKGRSNFFGGVFGGTARARNSSGRRVTLNGNRENTNEGYSVGGKYRLMSSAVVSEECDASSKILGELRKGTMVLVNEVHIIPRESGAMVTRMMVSSENISAVGWLSATGDNGERIVDARDHLEYQKLLGQLQPELSQFDLANPVLTDRSGASAQDRERVPTPPEPTAPPPDPPNVTKQELELLPGAAERNAEAGMQDERHYSDPSSPSKEASPSNSSPAKSMHPETSGHDSAAHRHDYTMSNQRSGQDPFYVKGRPWSNSNSGYRALNELEEEKDDDRAVGDNIDHENTGGICGCRAGFLSCGSLARRDKVKTNGFATNGMFGGMIGEPAPEPRPMRQLPSPPAFHATAIPS